MGFDEKAFTAYAKTTKSNLLTVGNINELIEKLKPTPRVFIGNLDVVKLAAEKIEIPDNILLIPNAAIEKNKLMEIIDETLKTMLWEQQPKDSYIGNKLNE